MLPNPTEADIKAAYDHARFLRCQNCRPTERMLADLGWELGQVRAERDSASAARTELEATVATLRAEVERLRDALAREYQTVAPVVDDFPVQLFEHLGEGYCKGRWAEDGSPYQFKVPEQLVPAFFALQRLARLCADTARLEGGAK